MSPIIPVTIEQELAASYLDYAMSVIVSRALPDVRDGLKPVQRRLLYTMYELGLYPDKPYKKCARIVGDTLGKFHPHGDVPVYEALVRLAQDFTMRYPLIDGQGNFGSLDNDPPAAMRYTEARLAPIALELLADIDKGTVDFVPNFDGSLQEPSILPARLPNLLVNGCSGIAVGMSTNIPPHNLTEVCQALAFLIDHPDAQLSQIMEYIKGPDFPTGGIILGTEGIEEAYRTGQGKLVLQAQIHLEKSKGKNQIIISSIPYQVSKAAIVEKIATLAKEGKIDGIAEVRDESDRSSIRVVVELKKEAYPQLVINQLYALTPLRSSYSLNFLALVNGKPKTLGLLELLRLYLDHRYQVVLRRSSFELDRLKERAHILEGLKVALENLDKVVELIRGSAEAEKAKQKLIENFSLTASQAGAILEMPLRRLCALEVNCLLEELRQINEKINELQKLLSSPRMVWELIKQELLELAQVYDNGRRTQIIKEVVQVSEEELIPSQKVMVALNQEYIKRFSPDSFRGKQISIQAEQLISLNTHSYLLLITEKGRVYRLKAFQVPEADKNSRGTLLASLLPIKEKIAQILAVEQFREPENRSLLLITSSGRIKRVGLGEFNPQRRQGLKALELGDGERVMGAAIGDQGEQVVLISRGGKILQFSLDSLPLHSRQSRGIIGQKLAPADELGFVLIPQTADSLFLLVTEKGYGVVLEQTSIPSSSPGDRGKRVMEISKNSGPIAAAGIIFPSRRIAIITSRGIAYIAKPSELPLNEKSLILSELKEDERVLALAPLD